MPLKIGIAADILAALPDLSRGVLGTALAAYTKSIMYLQAIDRIDLNGNPAGQVTTAETGHAIAVLVGIMAARAAQRKPVTKPGDRAVSFSTRGEASGRRSGGGEGIEAQACAASGQRRQPA